MGIGTALHLILYVRLTTEGGGQSEAHDKMLLVSMWLVGAKNRGVSRHPDFNRQGLLVDIK